MAALAGGDARAADAQRVAIRVADPTAHALMQRIRGQTSDLDQEILEVGQPPMEPRIADELGTAKRLAAQLDARVVVWFDMTGESLTLFFAIPRENRTLVRTMERTSAEPVAPSATLEAAALVVRSVLRALASGATIGVTLARPLDEPTAPAPPEAPARPVPMTAPLTGPSSVPWGWLLAAGWHGTGSGAGAWLQGIEARAGVANDAWTVGVQLSLDAPTELTDRYATVRLSRAAAGAFAGYAVGLGESFRVVLAVGAGAVGFPRQSVDVSAGVSRAADAWNASALFASEVGAAYRRRWLGVVWGVGVRAGADFVLTPPTIGYDVAGTFVAEHTLWNVEPKAVVLAEVGSL
jgi:hypothetical protein